MTSKRQKRRRHRISIARVRPNPRPAPINSLRKLCELLFNVPEDIYDEARSRRYQTID